MFTNERKDNKVDIAIYKNDYSKFAFRLVGWKFNIGFGIDEKGKLFICINFPAFWKLLGCNYKDVRINNGRLRKLNW